MVIDEIESGETNSLPDLVKIVSICQGKKYKVNMKTNYKYPNDSELDKMEGDDLRSLINEMTSREPGTYKYVFTPQEIWTKPRLIDFILTCQNVPLPRKKSGGNLFVGGGWCL